MIFKLKEMLDWLAFPLYLLRGCLPWSPGYYTAKKKAICSAIDNGSFKSGSALPLNYGRSLDERVIEYPWLFDKLRRKSGRMLDAGSALNHGYLVKRSPIKDANLTIMTLAPEKRCFWNRKISYVFGDLRDPIFADFSFDVVVCISTLEHIGLNNSFLYTEDNSKKESDALGFLPVVTDFKRILSPGGECYLTVPYGKRGVHDWYQVFDAKLVQQVIETFQPSEHTVEYFGYSPKGWFRASAAEIKDAEFYDANKAPLPAFDSAAGARGVACLRMIA